MSKNILLISASPRQNGNSDILCDEFARGAREAGHHAEKIRLAESDIKYCTGCCACIGGRGTCVQQDDMNDIFNKVLAADVLVLASPVYFRSFNGQMKTFIDRLCPIYSSIRNKDFYFVTGCLSGIRERDTIAITGVWDEGGVRGTKVLKEAYEAGLNV
jgi:multimeric flavodoxin WrbA